MYFMVVADGENENVLTLKLGKKKAGESKQEVMLVNHEQRRKFELSLVLPVSLSCGKSINCLSIWFFTVLLCNKDLVRLGSA